MWSIFWGVRGSNIHFRIINSEKYFCFLVYWKESDNENILTWNLLGSNFSVRPLVQTCQTKGKQSQMFFFSACGNNCFMTGMKTSPLGDTKYNFLTLHVSYYQYFSLQSNWNVHFISAFTFLLWEFSLTLRRKCFGNHCTACTSTTN